jgi:hypothetical protein
MASEASGTRLQDDTPAANGGLPGAVEVWRALATERAEVIRDLRARLDAESEERRRLIAGPYYNTAVQTTTLISLAFQV